MSAPSARVAFCGGEDRLERFLCLPDSKVPEFSLPLSESVGEEGSFLDRTEENGTLGGGSTCRLVAASVFKTDERRVPSLAGSIPVCFRTFSPPWNPIHVPLSP